MELLDFEKGLKLKNKFIELFKIRKFYNGTLI